MRALQRSLRERLAKSARRRFRRLMVEPLESRLLLACTAEDPNDDNGTRLTAGELVLTEDPANSGLLLACGAETISPANANDTWSDPDYWRFEALAGDHVAMHVDTPNSDLNPCVELRNGADGVLASDDNAGPDLGRRKGVGSLFL